MFIDNINIRKPLLAIIPFFIIIAFGVSSINACAPPPDCDTPDRYVMWAEKGGYIIAQSELSENVYLDYYSVPHTVKYILIGQVIDPFNNNNYLPFVTQFDYSYGTASTECGDCTAKDSTFTNSGGSGTRLLNTFTVNYNDQQALAGYVQGTHTGWNCEKDGYGSYVIHNYSTVHMDVYVVKVDIKRNGVSIVSNDPTVSVGEKISLTGTVEPSAANAFVSSNQWTIQGTKKVKNYIADTTEGRVVPLEPADLENTSVNYYWVNGGEDQQVTYVVELGNRAFGIEAYCDVKRPSADLTSITSTIIVIPNGQVRRLVFGNNAPVQAGISYNLSNSMSNGADGNLSFIQTIISSTRGKKPIGSNEYTSGTITNMLDKAIPYPHLSDSPFQDADTNIYDGICVDDNFSLWLMFKPTSANSIYVPIRRLNWQWKAIVTAPWTQIARQFTINPTGVDTFSFPIWDGCKL